MFKKDNVIRPRRNISPGASWISAYHNHIMKSTIFHTGDIMNGNIDENYVSFKTER